MNFKHKKIVVAVLLATGFSQVMAEDKQDASQTMTEVKVKSKRDVETPSEKTKSYSVSSTQTATKMSTSLKDTPQSVSVVTRALMDDFHLNNINDVLDYATGIKVERVEPSRNYYTARGSDITNFQIDGIGVPFVYGLVFGDIDTAVYDRIEVLRGANGLMTGTGNPSATINFIRKRPTVETQSKVSASVGNWDYRRLDADVSGKLNEDGSIRGRLVAANQVSGSYLDRYSTERNVLHGVLEFDLSDQTLLTIGHTYQKHDASGAMWGSLPLLYSDGSKRHYGRSSSSSPDWTYWNTINNVTFAELQHQVNDQWKVKAQLTRKEINADSRLFYVSGAQNTSTGTGLFATSGMYRDTIKDWIADVYVNGMFELGGRQHELVAGATWSKTRAAEVERSAGTTALTDFESISDFSLPANFALTGSYSNYDNIRFNRYVAGKFNLADPLKVTIGANMLSYDYSGISYGAAQASDATNKVTPYVGAVYALDPQHSAYASYTEIYNPQVQLDANFKILPPVQGSNREVGLKSEWFDQRLNTTVAYFDNKQENFAQSTGAMVGIVQIYEAIDVRTKGFELDMSGEISDGWSMNAGLTRLMSVKDNEGNNAKTYTPRTMAHLATTYKVQSVPGLKVGASVNWQSKVYADIDMTSYGAGVVRYTQNSYALLNLLASYDINPHWQAAVNLNNVTNEKYLASMMWVNYGQGYYAPGTNGYATLTWKY
jgi:outer-membrane receptor for ferric coprogen and ferric-rhodotorulic acid